MAKQSDDTLAAYVKLRQSGVVQNLPVLKKESQRLASQIAELQLFMAKERAQSVIRSQGLLFAWAYTRVQSQREFDRLARQPWLAEAAIAANGKGLRLAARLQNAADPLVLEICPLETLPVTILKPAGTSGQISHLFQTLVGGLVSDGLLVDTVAACAQRLELTLDCQQTGRSPGISEAVTTVYLRLRAEWLGRKPVPTAVIQNDPGRQQERLDDLYRELFIIDQQIKELIGREQDSGREREFEEEFKVLSGLPEVKSLTAAAQRVEVETQDICADRVLIGKFRLSYDFNRQLVQMVNTTRPQYDDGIRFDHPHVREGNACLGNIQAAVAEMMASYDLPRLIPLTLDFLKSYNSSNPHWRLEEWM